MTDLEDGFYWVRWGDVWGIGKLVSGYWWLPMAGSVPSTSFCEIDPRRIVREGGETK